MHSFHTADENTLHVSLPEDRVRVSAPGEEPARYREVQSATVTFRSGRFRTDDALLAERLRRESGFGLLYTETAENDEPASPKARPRPRRAAAPDAPPAPGTTAEADTSAPGTSAEPDDDGTSAAETESDPANEPGDRPETAPAVVRGVATLQAAAETLLGPPYGVALAALTDQTGRLNPARLRAAADAASVAFPDLFEG